MKSTTAFDDQFSVHPDDVHAIDTPAKRVDETAKCVHEDTAKGAGNVELPALPAEGEVRIYKGVAYGYTSGQMQAYARAALDAQRSSPSDEELLTEFREHAEYQTLEPCEVITFARALLSKYGAPAPKGEPVAWMTADGRTANAQSRSGMHPMIQEVFCIPLCVAPARRPEVPGVTLDGCLETLFRLGEYLGLDYAASRKMPEAPSDIYIKAIEQRVIKAIAASVNEQDSHYKPPFDNCQFKLCDLPGQCRGEGKCHHPARINEQDVRKILLRVEPGFNGQGVEVYAKSVSEVVDVLSGMSSELEEWQLGIRRLPTSNEQDAIDAAFDAVRKRLCELQRCIFVIGPHGGVRRAKSSAGNWIEFDEAHKLFDPVAVDAAIAQQGEETPDA